MYFLRVISRYMEPAQNYKALYRQCANESAQKASLIVLLQQQLVQLVQLAGERQTLRAVVAGQQGQLAQAVPCFLFVAPVVGEHQNGYIKNIVFRDGKKAPLKALYARLPFVQHSTIRRALGCELTTDGYMKIDAAQRTTIHGVFACRDNTTPMRTVVDAVSMGTTTGLMVNKVLIEETF